MHVLNCQVRKCKHLIMHKFPEYSSGSLVTKRAGCVNYLSVLNYCPTFTVDIKGKHLKHNDFSLSH